MVYLTILLISLVLSLISLPFWLVEREREKERHARQLEAIRAENARLQQDQAYYAWMAQQQQAAEQQRRLGEGQQGWARPPQGSGGGPPPGWGGPPG
jgi:hypothetical protein